jgi:hypothetical protein
MRDGSLVLDFYIRDLDHVLLLSSDNERHQVLCPDVLKTSMKRFQRPELNWMVTTTEGGQPFLD